MFADLHIHSWYSDGTLSPEEIIEKAKSQNVTLISICDHEMIDAYSELDNLCADNNIKFIKGVEVIAVKDDREYHILAYNFDMRNKPLNDLFRYNRSILLDKGSKLIEKISTDYSSASMEEFLKYERNRRNGGWESIDYLKSKGLVKSWTDYADFARKYPVDLEKDFLHAEEVIKIIHNAGGYAVLAHPGDSLLRKQNNLESCKKSAAQFLNMGIDGFECYYPLHTDEETEFHVKFCCEHDLIITAGSDEHGGFNGEEYYIGAVKVRIEQLNLKNMI